MYESCYVFMVIDPKSGYSSDRMSATSLGPTNWMRADLVVGVCQQSSQRKFVIPIRIYQGVRMWRLRSVASRPEHYTKYSTNLIIDSDQIYFF